MDAAAVGLYMGPPFISMSTALHLIERLRRFAIFAVAFLLTGCASLPLHQIDQIGIVEIAWVKSAITTPVDPTAPTVVFQSGLGDGMSTWASIIKELPPSTSYFVYDRQGYGSSGAVSDQSRDPCQIARELRELLQTAGISPPYLLVCHSLGGQYQYAFARLFSADVAGMVLLDPTHPDHWSEMQRQAANVAAALSGIKSVAFSASMKAEFDGQAACLEFSRMLTTRVPTKILTRTRRDLTETPAVRAMVEILDEDWLSIIPDATRRGVKGAGHYIQRDKPGVVASEILSMLEEIQLKSQ